MIIAKKFLRQGLRGPIYEFIIRCENENCNNEIEIRGGKEPKRRFCSISCSTKNMLGNEQTKSKIFNKLKEHEVNDLTKQKISEKLKGRVVSEKTKEKLRKPNPKNSEKLKENGKKKREEIRNKLGSFENFKSLINKNKITTTAEYGKFAKENGFPQTRINLIYPEEWKGWADFFGNKIHKNRIYDDRKKILECWTWDTLREYGRKSKIKKKDWKSYAENHPELNLPKYPSRIFKEEFTDWFDFLDLQQKSTRSGNKRKKSKQNTPTEFEKNKIREIWTYKKIKDHINDFNFSREEYWKYCDEHPELNLPKYPISFFPKEWISWSNFFGYNGNWHKSSILKLLYNLRDNFLQLPPALLYAYFSSEESTLLNNPLVGRLLQTNQNSRERKAFYDAVFNATEKEREEFIENIINNEDNEYELSDEELLNKSIENIEELNTGNTLQTLVAIDQFQHTLGKSQAGEYLEFVQNYLILGLWNDIQKAKNQDEEIQKIKAFKVPETSKSVIEEFLQELEEVQNWQKPSDYCPKDNNGNELVPYLMQKLTAYYIAKRENVGNWSGGGAGKTQSALLAAGFSNLTIVIVLNPIVEQWKNVIEASYKNVRVIVNPKYQLKINPNQRTFVVINYDKFSSNPFRLGKIGAILRQLQPEFVILDEIQKAKQRGKDQSNRRENVEILLAEYRTKNETKVLSMTATPIENNLMEGKKLLELATGESHDYLDTKATVPNAFAMYKKLTNLGPRFKKPTNIKLNKAYPVINVKDDKEVIRKFGTGEIKIGHQVALEKLGLEIKLKHPDFRFWVGNGHTMIYTHYVGSNNEKDVLIDMIEERVKSIDKSYTKYTGRDHDEQNLKDFIAGKYDVLICSSPVSEGVDGLQKICNNLLILIPPWKHTSEEQLIWRIHRPGQKSNIVNVITPIVDFEISGRKFSHDRRRQNIILNKKAISDTAVDGVIPANDMIDTSELSSRFISSINEWIRRVENGEELEDIPYNPILPPILSQTEEQKEYQHRQRIENEFSELNKRWSISNSDTIHNRLIKDPQEWHHYHQLYSEARKSWSEIPYKTIAKRWLSLHPEWVVGDFGCGEDLLRQELINTIHSFDHVACNDHVIVCDMKAVPLKDNTLDAAVFSLSLMGLNSEEYISEAYRVLRPLGYIFIAEPVTKWENRIEELKQIIENKGFSVSNCEITQKFIYLYGPKK